MFSNLVNKLKTPYIFITLRTCYNSNKSIFTDQMSTFLSLKFAYNMLKRQSVACNQQKSSA